MQGSRLGRFTVRAVACLATLLAVPMLVQPPGPAFADPAHAGLIAFSVARVSVAESDGTVSIGLNRADGYDGSVSVHWTTSDDSAHAGSDYAAASGDATFTDQESFATF